MNGRVVTVFGGSGFVGRYMVRRLAAAGARVRVAVPHPSRALFLSVAGVPGQVVSVRADVRDAASVRAAMLGSDAAILSVGLLAQGRGRTFDDYHVHAADTVGAACVEVRARAVLISALGASARSASAYARTKAMGENAFFTRLPGGVVLRPSVVFGDEDQFFNRLAQLARFKIMPLIGGGITPLQPVYVDNVAEAAVRVLFDDAHAGKVFSLGGPRVLTFAQCAQLAAEHSGRRILPVPLPFAVAEVLGLLLERLPGAPFTYDQVRLLQQANVVPADALGFADLDMVPTPVESVLPAQLRRYRDNSAYDLGHGLDVKNSRRA